MELTGRVMAEHDSCEPHKRPVEIYVDAIGLGYGVIDAINEIGRLSAVAINVAESASMSGTYMNLRAELWFKFKAFLEEGLCKLPKNEGMIAESSINNLLSLKYKIQSLNWVHNVITLLDIPLLNNSEAPLQERLESFKTLKDEGVDKERGFKEILNSPVFRNFVISEDGNTSGIIVYIKKMNLKILKIKPKKKLKIIKTL